MSGRFDVIVAGAGPAGSATAIHLARAGRRVLLVERSGYERMRMGETLPPAVNPLLAELGVLADCRDSATCPSYETASAWGGDEVADRSFIFSPHGHGWHVDRAAFDAPLAERAVAAGAVRRRGTWWARAWLTDDGVAVEVDGAPIAADHLVDATGRAARLARQLGAQAQAVRRAGQRGGRVRAASRHTDRRHVPRGDGRRLVVRVAAAGQPADRRPVHRRVDCRARGGLRDPTAWWAALQRRATRARRWPAPASRSAAPRLTSCAGHVLDAGGDAVVHRRR